MVSDNLKKYDFGEILSVLEIEDINDIKDVQKIKTKLIEFVERYRGAKLSEARNEIVNIGMDIVEILGKIKEKRNDKTDDELDEETRSEIEQLKAKLKELKEQQQVCYDKKISFIMEKNRQKKIDKFLDEIRSFEADDIKDSIKLLHIFAILKYNVSIKQFEVKKTQKIFHKKTLENSLKNEKEREILCTLYKDFIDDYEGFARYISDNLLARENNKKNPSQIIDKNTKIENYRYAIKASTPRKILDYKTQMGEMVKAYVTGEFAYKTGAFQDNSHSILTVLRDDGKGNLRIYNGVMQLSERAEVSPEFYADYVFSDFNMENAINNFGYFGTVYADSEGNRKLSHNEVCIHELITALYIANNYPERSKSEISLPDFYKKANEAVNLAEKSINNNPDNHGEGGR